MQGKKLSVVHNDCQCPLEGANTVIWFDAFLQTFFSVQNMAIIVYLYGG